MPDNCAFLVWDEAFSKHSQGEVESTGGFWTRSARGLRQVFVTPPPVVSPSDRVPAGWMSIVTSSREAFDPDPIHPVFLMRLSELRRKSQEDDERRTSEDLRTLGILFMATVSGPDAEGR